MIAIPFVAIDVLLVVLWTIAAALAIALIMDKLASILAGVPWVGGKLSDAVKSMAQAITGACGQLLSGTESVVGGGLHWLARHFETWLNQFVAHATVLARLAQIVGNAVYDVSGLRALVHGLTRLYHGIEHRVKALEREWHGIEHRVKVLEQDVAKGIGSDVLPRIKTLEREIGRVERQTIPAIRSDVATAENNITALGEYIRANFLSDTTDAITAAVAVGLAALGLGGLRCNSLLNSLRKRGCGLWSGLEDLFGLLIDGLIFLDLCHVIPTIEGLFADLEAPLVDLVSAAANAACAHPPSGWVELPAPTIYGPTSSEITATL